MHRFRHHRGRRGRAAGLAARALTAASTLALAAALALVAAAPASAHILNEKTQFPDIEFVDARLDIVMLVGAGLIPQTPVFLPDDPLSGKDLAAWVALAHGLGEGGETPNVDALAQAALSQGVVASLDEPATYADINRLLFDDSLALPEDLAVAVPTRAEAAAFVAQHLFEEAGQTLVERLGVRPGPTGVVDAVRVNEVEPGDHHAARYSFVFGDTAYDVDVHGRVGNGPVDLLQWEGLYVVRSLLKGSGDGALLTYVEAGEPDQDTAASDETGDPPADAATGGEAGEGAGEAAQTATDDTPPDAEAAETDTGAAADAAGLGLPFWFWVLLLAIAVLGAFLFAGGRRRS